jgi:hypothetical protein
MGYSAAKEKWLDLVKTDCPGLSGHRATTREEVPPKPPGVSTGKDRTG